jgi:hypothetical protein
LQATLGSETAEKVKPIGLSGPEWALGGENVTQVTSTPWNPILNRLRESNSQHRILYPAKLPVKSGDVLL